MEKSNIDKQPYFLLGHSFGGFIAGHYAVKYPFNIKGLILMSPLGVPVQ